MASRLRSAVLSSVAAAAAALAAGCGPTSPRCLGGQTDCGGVCRTLSRDAANCGACGNACGAALVCVSGSCQACPAGQARCGSACKDLLADALNCGSCGHDCGAGTCAAGSCACGAAVDCGASQSPQCRTDTQTNALHCGPSCAACAIPGQICASGACQCPAAWTDCPGPPEACADTRADRAHCGTCTTACGPNEICASSACAACAGATPVRCGNACTDTQTDAANCGGCGLACVAGQVCAGGSCRCPGTQTLCGGACVDTASDPANCGACGNACGTGQSCAGSACACGGGLATCPAGGKTCCAAGSACACAGNTACQPQHDLGIDPLGSPGGPRTFFDCAPPGTAAAALAAAAIWSPAGAPATGQAGVSCSFTTECVAWFDAPAPGQSRCAVWCYAGLFAGLVLETSIQPVCNCPIAASPAWH